MGSAGQPLGEPLPHGGQLGGQVIGELAKQIVVKVQQTQTVDPYRFSLGIGVAATSGGLPAVRQVAVTARDATFTIPADAEPASVVLDPGVWLLAEFGAFQQAVAR